jgi:hypothetical protein
LISLPKWRGYSTPPGQQPEHDNKITEKQDNHKHAPPHPLCSVKLLLQEISPPWLLVVCAASNASPDMAELRVHYLQHHICEAANSNNVLLEQPDDEDELLKLAKDVRKGSEEGRRLALTRTWLLAWHQSTSFSSFFFLLRHTLGVAQRPSGSSHSKSLLPAPACQMT